MQTQSVGAIANINSSRSKGNVKCKESHKTEMLYGDLKKGIKSFSASMEHMNQYKLKKSSLKLNLLAPITVDITIASYQKQSINLKK